MALHTSEIRTRKYFSRKGAKAQRKTLKRAVLCVFAPLREKFPPA